MANQSSKKRDAGIPENEADQLLKKHLLDDIRKRAEAMQRKSGAELSVMSSTEIEKLVYEFQVHQIELELQNEELKRTHDELSASRDDFARLYDFSPVAYLRLDKEDIIKKTNIAATQLLGCSKEMLINKKFGKFIHPSDQDDYYFFIHDLLMQKNTQILSAKLMIDSRPLKHFECQGFALLGCSRPLCIHSDPHTYVELRGVVNGNFQDDFQICLAIQDVTEYKRTQETISCLNEKLEKKVFEQTSALIESNLDLTGKIEELKVSRQQLREREARLNAIFNASIEGIITIDSSGIILTTNKAVEKIFGYREEELIGCSYNELLSPLQRKKQGDDLNSYLQAKVLNLIGLVREVEGMRKDGSIVPLDISIVEFSIDGANYFLIRKILQLGEANIPNEARWWPQRRVDATEVSQDGSAG